MTKKKKAIIIGAGPAGLTAAVELIRKSDIIPVVYEAEDCVGGLSRTVDFNGNKLDIGGHRFFSKSDTIVDWWLDMLPLQENPEGPPVNDQVMLLRKRLSRIYFLNRLFSYPIKLNLETFKNLGFNRTFKICASYLKIRLTKEDPIETLEDLFIHRFGKELYYTFFKGYTEKVWGVSCKEIKPEWGSQRIKNLSIAKTIMHALKENFLAASTLHQKSTVTSLITRFMYPKYGPGQLWDEAARRIQAGGGSIILNRKVTGLTPSGNKFTVESVDQRTGDKRHEECDYVISTMPVKDLISAMHTDIPDEVRDIAGGLVYRDFLIAGVLLKKLKIDLADQWIYIQENYVKAGRLQLFNNWSPYLVKDPGNAWIGAEYFCNEGDELWSKTDAEMKKFAIAELELLKFIDPGDVIDAVVVRQPKAYPAYFGPYDDFPVIRSLLDQFKNLFLVGRNGMHRYNNQDHSMLSAMTAVDNIVNGITSKDNIWEINTEEKLHEVKS